MDDVLVAVAIAGVLSLYVWAGGLLVISLLLIPEVPRLLGLLLTRRAGRADGGKGGVGDEWLDGPTWGRS
jgi:hypothetical protein